MTEKTEPIDPRIWKIACVVMMGPFMTNLDATVVNVSLASLSHELHAPLAVIQWVTSGYLLSLALMLPLSGWLVDRVGAKNVYLACFTSFTAASVLCGVASSAGSLIAFRVLQGAAGGLLTPMGQMMMARTAGKHFARVMGISVVPVILGPLAGPTLAGLLLQHASWRWIFLINLPIGILATALALWLLPRDEDERSRRSFDLAGFLLLSPGLVLLLHGLERVGSGSAHLGAHLAEVLLALGLLGAFGIHARRQGKLAIVETALFRGRTFAAASVTMLLSNATALGGQFLIPLYLMLVSGKSPSETGLLLAPTGIGMVCALPWMGRLVAQYGPQRVSAVGTVLALLGTLPFALCGAGGMGTALVVSALFVRGVGLGSINVPAVASAYAGLDRAQVPMATTALNIVQRLGGPAATTLLALELHRGMEASGGDGMHPGGAVFTLAFSSLCVLHALGIFSALRLPTSNLPVKPTTILEAVAD